MSPDSDGNERTIPFNLEKAIPDRQVVKDIRKAISRVHEASIYASELVNIHIRKELETKGTCPAFVFDNNALKRTIFHSVLEKDGKHEVHEDLKAAFADMPPFQPVNATGLVQVIQYVCNNIAATASNNVWMHFKARVSKHVHSINTVPEAVYKAMSADEKRRRKLIQLRLVGDICSMRGEEYKSDTQYHQWILSQRKYLEIDQLLSLDHGRLSFEDVVKKYPEVFTVAMYKMALKREEANLKCFAIYPLRRHMVDRFVHMDERTLNEVLQAMRNERLHRKRKRNGDDTFTFGNVFHLGKLSQRWRLMPSFDTDGVSVHFKQLKGSAEDVKRAREKRDQKYAALAKARADTKLAKEEGRDLKKEKEEKEREREKDEKSKPKKTKPKTVLEGLPKRGIWSIDEIKHLSRKEYHVIGIDPGKHNLIFAADSEKAKSKSGQIRYTLKERQKDMRTRQFADEGNRGKHPLVQEGEENLSRYNSRSVSLDKFVRYCTCRRSFLHSSLEFYGQIDHRRRRWMRKVKMQQSETKLYKKLDSLRTDDRPLLLAYGSWGLTTSKRFNGLPPCIGVGLLRKISKRFLVVPTPEHYTSKTCAVCFHECGAHPTLKRMVKKRQEDGSVELKEKEIRGLRVCQNECCKLFMNRDKMGSIRDGI